MASHRGVLRHREDIRSLGFHATWFALVAVQWTYTPTNPLVALPLYALTLVLSFVAAVNVHNIMHCPIFTKAWMNDVYRVLATWWYGQPVSLYVPVHNHSHHKHCQTRKDLTRSTKAEGTWQLWNMWKATRWASAAARDCKLYFDEQKRLGKKIYRNFRIELAGIVVFYVALLALSIWQGKWWAFPVYVFLPHAFGMFCIKAINFLQHDGCDYDLDGWDHSRNFVGPWFNWVFLNNGFHTIHHMRPGLHWSVLPEVHMELVHGNIHPALEVRHFGSWFWREIVWPGERKRFDGADFEWPPWGEGPDEAWDYMLDEAYQRDVGGLKKAV